MKQHLNLLINRMMSTVPEERPSAEEVLRELLQVTSVYNVAIRLFPNQSLLFFSGHLKRREKLQLISKPASCTIECDR